jgi:NAD-dependent DNA ligase
MLFCINNTYCSFYYKPVKFFFDDIFTYENTYSNYELIEWATKLSPNEIFSFEWKVDGASIVLYYINGEGDLCEAKMARKGGKKK